MEKRYCPETSKDANGPTGITGLRFCLMWLANTNLLMQISIKVY